MLCQTFFPGTPVPLTWAQPCQVVLGAWFSLQPWPLLEHTKEQAGPPQCPILKTHQLVAISLPYLSSGKSGAVVLVAGSGTKLLLADPVSPLFCFSEGQGCSPACLPWFPVWVIMFWFMSFLLLIQVCALFDFTAPKAIACRTVYSSCHGPLWGAIVQGRLEHFSQMHIDASRDNAQKQSPWPQQDQDLGSCCLVLQNLI